MRSALRRNIFKKCGHKKERQRASNLLSHMPSLEPYKIYITAMKFIHEFMFSEKDNSPCESPALKMPKFKKSNSEGR